MSNDVEAFQDAGYLIRRGLIDDATTRNLVDLIERQAAIRRDDCCTRTAEMSNFKPLVGIRPSSPHCKA